MAWLRYLIFFDYCTVLSGISNLPVLSWQWECYASSICIPLLYDVHKSGTISAREKGCWYHMVGGPLGRIVSLRPITWFFGDTPDIHRSKL